MSSAPSPAELKDRLRLIADALAPEGSRCTCPGLKGSAPAYLLSRLLPVIKRRFLVIAPDQDTAEIFQKELAFFIGNSREVAGFPPWDTAPFEEASPVAEVSGQRLDTLFRLQEGRCRVVVTTLAAAAQRVLPRQVLGDSSWYLVAGEEVERDRLLTGLLRLGYQNVPLVEDRGTFAVRGGILDIFPAGLSQPVRIEFFGDEVESIRAFDPETQRSLQPIEELVLLPSREVILTDEIVAAFAPRLKPRCDELDVPPSRRREYLEQVQNAAYPLGIEYLQPLFHPDLETLGEYLGPGTVTVLLDPAGLEEAAEQMAEELATGERRAAERGIITCRRDELWLPDVSPTAVTAGSRTLVFPGLELAEEGEEAIRFRSEENKDLKVDVSRTTEHALTPLVNRLGGWQDRGWRTIFVCHHQTQAQRLMDLFSHYPLSPTLAEGDFPTAAAAVRERPVVLVGDISRGFQFTEERLAVIAEEELFGRRVRRRGISEARKKQLLSSLAEMKPGDYIVHVDHGIGWYRGLQHVALGGGIAGDFLHLEYAGGDKLYLPVDRINLVQRYVGAEGAEPKVDKLGGTAWEKTKGKARAAIEEMAEELLALYAERQVREGYAFSAPDEMYREFEAAFAFEETPDQLSAIEDVISDMRHTRPMDRLICGDVGYGKTEVAMRGAFKAVMDGKQVAVLVPTTVLAQQHLETFRERFKEYPVTVEMVSRFRTAAEQKEILAKVKKGEVDILVGTHRLLQSDVLFRDLGLLIVDEEQRFGVVHKEKLKKFRATVDILTLTATPIPRTLYMSLMGIRDLSVIDTPPADRLAIKTIVARSSDELIREAIIRELRRGGQVFFVHNRVQSIGAMAEHLRQLVPEATIGIGHGQMEEKELERVMCDFMHAKFNVLLCTTIIESGLDISAANTLIVNRADTFGLSQLYQIRGRVGRSKVRAYAYLLIPGEGAITADARERLKIMQDLTELGAGFRIASHDLELRGAGDLLGARQSGNIATVGFELYTELLEEAVARLKGESVAERVDPEIKLRVPAFIPEEYVGTPNQRLVIYKRLTQATSEDEVDDIRAELADRFGPLPVAAAYLIEVMKIRVGLTAFLVKEVEFDGRRLIFSFHERTPVSPDTIIALIRKEPKVYRFTPEFQLFVELTDTSFDGVLGGARNVLKRLALCV